MLVRARNHPTSVALAVLVLASAALASASGFARAESGPGPADEAGVPIPSYDASIPRDAAYYDADLSRDGGFVGPSPPSSRGCRTAPSDDAEGLALMGVLLMASAFARRLSWGRYGARTPAR